MLLEDTIQKWTEIEGYKVKVKFSLRKWCFLFCFLTEISYDHFKFSMSEIKSCCKMKITQSL